MTEKIEIPPIPEKAFDDPWHNFMIEMRETLVAVNDAVFDIAEEEAKEEAEETSEVLGFVYRLPSEQEFSGAGESFEASFKVGDERLLIIVANLSVKGFPEQTVTEFATFDIYINDVLTEEITVGINNNVFRQETAFLTASASGRVNIRLEQVNDVSYILEAQGSNSISVIELKE